MGKLIISTHITVDGVIGPNPGEWGIFEGEGERFKYDQLLAADAFLLGRLDSHARLLVRIGLAQRLRIGSNTTSHAFLGCSP